MQESGLLATLAEVSIVFAGFTGVVGTLGRRKDQAEWNHLFHIGGMLGFSLIAAFFSLLPLVLSAVGLSEVAVWRSASAGLCFAMAAWEAFGVVRLRSIRESGERDSRLLTFFVVIISTTALVILVLAANVAGWLAHPGGVYLICVFVPLVFAGLWFLRLFLSVTVPPPA